MYYLCYVETTKTLLTMKTQEVPPIYLAKVRQVSQYTTRIDAVRITNDKYVVVCLSKADCASSFTKDVMNNLGFKFTDYSPISQAQFKSLCNNQLI